MESKRLSNLLRIISRTAIIGVIVSVALGVAGCGDQIARMEENQLKLQAMIEANAEQIAIIAANMEQNQYELENRVGKVQNGTSDVVADIAAVADMQMKLEAMVQSNTEKLSGKVAAEVASINDKQMQLEELVQSSSQQVSGKVSTDLDKVVDMQMKLQDMVQSNTTQLSEQAAVTEQLRQEVQTGIESSNNETQKLINAVAVITDEQAKQREIIQSNSENFDQRLAAVEQNQEEWQTTADLIQDSIEKLGVTVDALGQKLVTLRDIVQTSVQEMNERMQALNDSVNTVQQGQSDLQQRLEADQMQTSDTAMTSVLLPESPEAIDEMEGEFYPVESVEFVDVTPYPTFKVTADTNSVQ